MTTYTYPEAWGANRFEMRVVPNQRTYPSMFSPSTVQVVDLGGDYWMARVSIPPARSPTDTAAREAFVDRLRGQTNSVSLYHLKRPVPLGTLRDGASSSWTTGGTPTSWTTGGTPTTWRAGQPALRSAVAQFATTATVCTVVGRTLLAGDHIGLGSQTVRVLADATADASGDMSIEFAPAARSSIAAYTRVTWDKPTVTFRLRDGGDVPNVYVPGFSESMTLDLVEAT